MTSDIEKTFKEKTLQFSEKFAETLGIPKNVDNKIEDDPKKKESVLYKLKKEIDSK